jgi:Flp pilus assembly protein TadD
MKILTLSEKRKQIAEAKKRKKAKSPSQEELIRLLEHYQTGQYDDAEKLAVYITQEFPYHQFGWKVLGAILGQTSRISEAVNANQKSVELAPQDAEAHYNLGITLQKLGRFDEAEASYTKAIAFKPDYALAHNNLGITLQELGRFDEAQASYTQAIALKPGFAEPHYNLGITLQELGRLDEAEASYTQAIAFKPDYALAHNNLGVTLKDLGRLAEAQASYTQAIALKPDYAEAHSNLGVVLHMNGDIDSGLESLEKANNIDPDLQNNHIILAILKARKALGITEFSADNISNLGYSSEQFPQPVILNRAIEAELISSLYKMKSIELSKFDNSSISDPRFGNGKCSRDFKLFKDDSPMIKSVAEDLTIIMREVVKSDIYISESFFNIFGAGGGSTPHKHIGKLDADEYLNFGKQKYSLVYYLSVGDQNCMDPGILKLYDPSEDILPYEGMIAIFPADRKHSSIYGGKKDRVMIGVNFYSLTC